jgi:gamma-glutamylcyclotransferase (GGCT)/AIG2-like uncharacterized protein YtfP
MQLVSSESLEHCNGRLANYQRFLVDSEVFPAIVYAPGEFVTGRVYFNIDTEILRRIDYFEADCYQRQSVAVRLDSGAELQAFVYVLHPDKLSLQSKEEWNEQFFIDNYLEGYLKNAKKWMDSEFPKVQD